MKPNEDAVPARRVGTFTFGLILVATGLGMLAALFFPFAAGIRRQPARLFCEGSLLFCAGLTAASCTGLFPVPVLGSGASPILGYLISATYAVKRLNAGEG